MEDIGTRFRDLHRPGDPFVLANVWDIGSARMMANLGASALATSSAAQAFTEGQQDGTITRDQALAHASDIVAATNLPVSGDFENGFGDSPETCAETVRLAAEVGLAGICIEDTELLDASAYAFDEAVERIRAAAAAARALPKDFVLTARADGVQVGCYDTAEAGRRLRAFAEAGADCLYAPMPSHVDWTARLCAEIRKPVNVLMVGDYAALSRSKMAAIGAARLSLGSTLLRATARTIHDLGHAILDDGDFTGLSNGLPFDQMNPLLTRKDG